MSDSVHADVADCGEGDDAALAERVAELADRLQRGETIDLSLEHGRYAGELRQLLPTICMMGDLADPAARDAALGSLGDFRILREAARGGMGVVYEAVQVSLGRRVALKVLLNAAALDPRHAQRFQVEAQAAASLHHPHIVPVFLIGSDGGIPFFAMQFIEGRNLAQALERWKGAPAPAQRAPRDRIRAAADFARQAAEALAYAHANDVIHRDIKPSNLLVDGRGHLWVTDFGLARVPNDSDLTRTGDNLGTPRYMSPEQAVGHRASLDGRTDVYSLGATLYELLTLRPAFADGDRLALLRRIADDEPVAPRRIDRGIPVDLETIVLKAMAKAPADRYATASDLAGDLRRFLDDRPILARRPAWPEYAWKWARRHRPVVATFAVVGALATVTMAAGAWRYTRALQAEVARSNQQAQRAVRAEERMEAALQEAEQQRGLAERHLFGARLKFARQALASGQPERARGILDEIVRDSAPAWSREFAYGFLTAAVRGTLTPAWPDGRTHDVNALSPDGSILASGNHGGPLEFLEIATGRTIASVAVPGLLDRQGAPCFSPDGRYFAITEKRPEPAPSPRGWIWEVATGRLVAELTAPAPERLWSIDLLAEGRVLTQTWSPAAAPRSTDRRVLRRLWSMGAGPAHPRYIANISDIDFRSVPSADGRLVATSEPGQIRIVDSEQGQVVRSWKPAFKDAPKLRAFWAAPYVLVEEYGGPVFVFRDASTGKEHGRVRIDRAVDSASTAFSSDARTVAIADKAAGTVAVWDLARGRTHTIAPRSGPGPYGPFLAFSPSGNRLVLTVSHGNTYEPLTVRDVASGKPIATCPLVPRACFYLRFLPDERTVLLQDGGDVWLWRLDHVPLAGHADEAWAVAFSRHGDLLASGSDDEGGDEPHTIKLWDPKRGRLVRGWFGGAGTVSSLAFAPDGQTLASAHVDELGSIRLWDVAQGELLATLAGHTKKARSVAFHPGGRWLASGAADGTTRIWDVAARRCERVLEGHEGGVQEVAFSPGGKALATAGGEGTLRLWDVATWKCRRVVPAGKLMSVAYSPDGSLIATVNEAGQIRFWDATTGARRGSIEAESSVLNAVVFTRGGEAVAAASADGLVRLWDVLTGQELLVLGRHAAQVNGLAFSPDGSTLASCGHDGSVWLWRGGSGTR